ncbi:MAG: 50S ribosomal protein L20 [Candidatus Brennerbacteria bacterium CG11_big_fil_rev_8_21_14_0_20_43_10]|uniref:Large ribosomal subunit protein bL20 n=3 Tax=Candidatus Brenneribacteriota TaxID=1817902 RepID=A0A2M8C1J4_9BACT|nr:MAG: 50S ribosomal protein L20 [Parcubacteria group bacterium CG1_02_44_31]PIP50327.1 MAG: 50S ribosomal protein L20 [Candidatus Brennerbacteria bacterium CG23_combo_of_CG06-09_8_20_14_all_44_41]PIR26329.1 MAG: 50S ribosomal protein L20 [Candidatus Brennerbacteria bacterium CG11_big_fil_rev_8_21_14_0_20_43_10]PIX28820.1 MAG: 50S ribosomal protein L20 [Candidatus Brennerbacteria bacterium CG_4_8_14_3_um_filter_43_14]PJA19512.1 MAG: 50S ribosomal protein L20 [Candidatus Brennerbacteria bacteri
MTRVKRGVSSIKKRKSVLKQTKGFRGSSKNKERQAKERLLHAYTHAYTGRKLKKRDFRSVWQIKINAAARQNNTTYSQLMHAIKISNIALDRKMLALLAEKYPKAFKALVKELAPITK